MTIRCAPRFSYRGVRSILAAMALLCVASSSGGHAAATPYAAIATRSIATHRAAAASAAPAHVAPLSTYPDLPGLPRQVDLSRWNQPPGDQGYVGSCAAWATIYSLAGWYANRQRLPGAPFAPMAIYHQSGYGENMGSLLVANLIAGMQGLVPMGFYTQGNYNYRSPLTPREHQIARHYRIADWYAVYQPPTFDPNSGAFIAQDDARHAIERALAQGVPLALSLTVFKAMRDIDAAHPYIDTEVAHSGIDGPHAVFASHYDARGLWIENSWGLDWGRGGYAELSWGFVNRYVDDALAISGLTVDRGAPVPVATRGPARLRVSGTLRRGHEVVVSGSGLRPRSVVALYRDGAYAGRWPVTPWGTVQIEAYFHPRAGEGPHNHRWTVGQHTLLVRRTDGPDIRITLTVEGR